MLSPLAGLVEQVVWSATADGGLTWVSIFGDSSRQLEQLCDDLGQTALGPITYDGVRLIHKFNGVNLAVELRMASLLLETGRDDPFFTYNDTLLIDLVVLEGELARA